MTNQKTSTDDFASFVDSQNEDLNKFTAIKEEPKTSRRPKQLLTTNDLRDGDYYPAIISSVELRNATNGYPFLRIRVALNNSAIELTHTKFIDRKKCDCVESIKAAATSYLSKFGYVTGQGCGQKCLAQIGSFEVATEPGRRIKVASKLFVNEKDRDAYVRWEDERAKRVMKQFVREPYTLPII